MFRLNRNERSHWSGNGVHVESELVFMIGRNMHTLHNPNYRSRDFCSGNLNVLYTLNAYRHRPTSN